MAKWKTTPPARKTQSEGNTKALRITIIVIGALVVLLGALVVFTNN
jgi:hypothetical protein